MSLFQNVKAVPGDPILGVVEDFNSDPRVNKVNLSIGIYSDEKGDVPILEAVKKADALLSEKPAPKIYLPMEGSNLFIESVKKLLFGEEHSLYQEERLATVQTLGGTGAIKIAIDFLADLLKSEGKPLKGYISDPTWTNHRALLEGVDFSVESYPYFDPHTHGVDFEAMYAYLSTLMAGSVIILHACCHNPTGADLTTSQWERLADLFKEKELIPLLDMAYQGFAEGIDADAAAIHIFAERNLPLFVANSFSKSFSLYGERAGALTVVGSNATEASNVQTQLKKMVRANYSSPPTYGARIVETVLSQPDLLTLWKEELTAMRERIKKMRYKFADLLNQKQSRVDFSFIKDQVGMFSYTGITKEEVKKLRDEKGLYMVDSGRICVASLNEHNIEAATDAIASLYQ